MPVLIVDEVLVPHERKAMKASSVELLESVEVFEATGSLGLEGELLEQPSSNAKTMGVAWRALVGIKYVRNF